MNIESRTVRNNEYKKAEFSKKKDLGSRRNHPKIKQPF